MNNHVYSKEQLDQMSDLELNKAVAEKFWLDFYIHNESVRLSSGTHLIDDSYFEPLKNYNDCMPIADKYGLVVKPALIKNGVVKTWSCNDRRFRPFSNGVSMLECVSIQPAIQRAIVYCFLMMEV